RGTSLLPALAVHDASVDLIVDGITGAGGALQAAHIEEGDIAAAVPNQLPALQGTGRAGHTHAANAQHQCQKFVGQVKLIRMSAITRHEQPTGEARFDEMKTCAGRRLHELRKKYV